MPLMQSFPTDHPDGLPIQDTRAIIAGLITTNSDGTPRTGLLRRPAAPLVTGTATWAYKVGPFPAVTARKPDGGVEFVPNPSDALTNQAAPAPSANSRWDIIYTRARFNSAGDPSSTPEIAVASGEPDPTNPQPPALPEGSEELARAVVRAGATSTSHALVTITQTARVTALAGVHPPASSDAERDDFWGIPTTDAERLALQLREASCYRSDKGYTERYYAKVDTTTNPQGAPTAGWYPVDGMVRGSTVGVLAGVAPPAGTPLIEQTGIASVTTNAAGDAVIILPKKFPNGLVSVHLDRLNFSNYGATNQVLNALQALDRISFRIYVSQTGAALPSVANVNFVFTAKGW